jgi:glycosyltransferase involved in cell wall biosynthesis
MTKRNMVIVSTVPSMVRAFLVNHIKYFNEEFDVTVLTNLSAQEVDLDVLPKNVRIVDLPINRSINICSDIKVLFSLFVFLYKHKISIVYSGTPKGGLLSMIAAWVARVPCRVHTFTGQVWVTKTGFSRLFLKWLDRTIAILATTIIIDSPSQREFLINNGVVKKNKSFVLGDGSISGVDIKRFCPEPTIRQIVRKEMGVNEEAVIFLYVGRLKKDKGVFELAHAFSLVCQNSYNAKLWLVGSDEDNVLADLKIILSGCIDEVCFIPYTIEPEKYMKAADVFCLPSYREGFGSAIIEAAACGIPAIGTNIYGITDAIIDKETGILVKIMSKQELEQAMNVMLENSSMRRKFGILARNRVINKFQQKQISEELIVLIMNELSLRDVH